MANEYASARPYFDESLAMKRALEDRWGIGATLVSLARTAQEDGDAEAAKALAAESLQIFEELGDRESLAAVLESIADLALTDEMPARALRLRAAAEALREAIGSPLPPNHYAWRDRTVTDAEEILGQPEASAATDAGRQLSQEAAVAEALEVLGAADRSYSS